MDDLLEVSSTMSRTTAIDCEYDIALSSHIEIPPEATSVEAILHKLGVGAIVDVDDRGIFLARIKVCGLEQAVIEVGDSIGSLDLTKGDLGVDEACFGIL